MQTLKHHSTKGSQSNVFTHIMSFVKDDLRPNDKEELLCLIGDYRNGLVPLIVPITLLNHFLRRYRRDYIDQQYYLAPHPGELMLRNSF